MPDNIRRHPAYIQATLETKNAEAMQVEMVARYGFELDDGFAADLRKHAGRKVKEMPALLVSKDAATVQTEYKALYGQEISEEYAGDLIAYFEKAIRGDSANDS